MATSNYPSSDARHQTASIKRMLEDTARHAREDVHKVDDPKARDLFAKSAEVLDYLRKAYEDFERKNAAAWR